MKYLKNFVLVVLMFTTFFLLVKSGLNNQFVVENNTEIKKPVYIYKYLQDTIVIPKGGSLCGTLKMSETEALAFAQKYNYPVRYNDWGEPNVIIQEGEIFIKHWQPDKLKYLVP